MKGSIFQFLASLFKKHTIKAVLVGGYAVIAYKIQRMTFDIDFMVSGDDCGKLEKDLLDAGYSVAHRTEAFVQFKSAASGLRDLDLLISDEKTINRLIAEGKKISIAGESFTVPSPLHLIEMKLHSMANNQKRELKDFPDVVQLMTLNQIDPGTEPVKKMFARHNAMALYEKTLEAVRSNRD